jgi:hypothetical protein
MRGCGPQENLADDWDLVELLRDVVTWFVSGGAT